MSDEKKPGPFDGVFDAAEKALEDMIGKPAVAHIKQTVQEAVGKKGVPPWSEFTDKLKRQDDIPSVADEAERSLFETRVRNLVKRIEYKEGYGLICEQDKKDPQGRIYIQVECSRPDVETGKMGVGRGGKQYLSEHMIDDEIIRRAFGLFMAYEEHECREFFKWRGRAIFGPHISSAALWEAADRMDFRS